MKMSCHSVIALILLGTATLCDAQVSDKQITYQAPAQPISRALKDIGKQAGVKLFVQQELSQEPIILHLKEVPLQVVMEKIAKTYGAEWIKRSDGYDLHRTPTIEDFLTREEASARKANFQTALEKAVRGIDLSSPMTQATIDRLAKQYATMHLARSEHEENWANVVRFQHSLPDALAAWQLIHKINPTLIGGLEDGHRVVFSNKPTHMEQPIEGDLSVIAQNLLEDHNRFVDAYAKTEKPKDAKRPSWGEIRYTKMDSIPDRFTLAFSKELFSSSIRVQLISFDAQNKPILTTQVSIAVVDDAAEQGGHQKLAKQVQSEPDIQVTPTTKQLLDLIRIAMSGNSSAFPPITGELRSALLNPEESDPLAFAVSDAYLGVATFRNENMVVYPDDSQFLSIMFAGQEGSLKPSLVLQSAHTSFGLTPNNVSEKDGWLLVNPTYRRKALADRMNRNALGEYLRSYDKIGFFSIDEVEKVVRSVQGSQMPLLGLYIPMMIAPEQGSDSVPQGDISLWKFYASLNPDQQRTLADRVPLHPGQLTPAQLEPLADFLYDGSKQYQNFVPGHGNSEAEQIASLEPCEVLPDGIPMDMIIGESDERHPLYFATMMSASSTFTTAMNIDSMASFLTLRERVPDAETGPEIKSIEPGSKRTITLYLSLPDKIGAQGVLSEEKKLPGGPWTLATLPPDVKAALDKAVQSERDRYNRFSQGKPPARIPPPPATY